MTKKAGAILLAASFLPVTTFKVLSGGGSAPLQQAKVAVIIGLALALTQIGLSKRLLNHTTYLEKAFVAFLALGSAWVFLSPKDWAGLFAAYSTPLLYVTLFLTTFVPQLLGYDPFTYAIAKQWYPEPVWKTPQFRTVNMHITCFWSAIFLGCFLSSLAGHGSLVFTIALPMALILVIGISFSRLYPTYYLKKAFKTDPVDPSSLPTSARDLIMGMPRAFDPVAARGVSGDIQFDLSGSDGAKLFVSIEKEGCTAHEGESPSPLLTIKTPGEVWLRLARGELDRPKALMEGLYSVEGDMALLMRMGDMFHARTGEQHTAVSAVADGQEEKGRTRPKEEGRMNILAVQGSPRPKMSNTETLLRRFLQGAQSEGATTETVYLREKNIHWCQGCYTCWTKTPGTCVFKDDMPEMLEKVKACDVIVYATPLYNYNVTALVKAFQERLLPLLDPHLVKHGNAYSHPDRYKTERKTVLVSNCGFPDVSHFDVLKALFAKVEEQGHGSVVGRILMPAGELLKQDVFRSKAQPVLDAVYRAGIELVREGRVSMETESLISTPFVPAEDMAAMANLSWDSLIETKGTALGATKVRDMRLLLKGMAATIDPKTAGDLKAVIQFHVTGAQPGNWYLSIESGACTMAEGEVLSPTLIITTPSDVWLAVANKEMDGQTAFMQGKYTVQGDMALLMRMASLFGG